MKIQDSSVQLSASHEASRSQTVEITHEQGFRKLFDSLAAPRSDEQSEARQRVQKLLQSLIDAILAAMDGKKCEADFAACDAAPPLAEAPPGRPEIAWQRTTTERLSESEKTTVCGKGQVNTCDGRQIDFDFSMAMARDFTSTKITDESGTVALRDPLILSFDGKACELTEEGIAFDLNADGSAEQIPGLGSGSAFLVFDRNGNGKADNGSELFGVASGNGFADLAQLDGDHNGWIDEADPAFKQLAVWSGSDFASLTERGVGALYTGSVDAPFSLKTGANELLGQIRAAGVYLTEAGEVGHMQQVDLAVSASPGGDKQPAEGQQLAA
ncbi:hypothetical protein [Dechloromonas sp. A34]|uniref:hypothetical protein n=1 Tax=Dechloromonas sp. A34 TaxID=447588 RepID=UPI00224963AB|nr:hypothetical protein [Dechloromonas sp. A34]